MKKKGYAHFGMCKIRIQRCLQRVQNVDFLFLDDNSDNDSGANLCYFIKFLPYIALSAYQAAYTLDTKQN